MENYLIRFLQLDEVAARTVSIGKYLLITYQAIFIRTVREVEITFHPKDSPITLKKIKMKIITSYKFCILDMNIFGHTIQGIE